MLDNTGQCRGFPCIREWTKLNSTIRNYHIAFYSVSEMIQSHLVYLLLVLRCTRIASVGQQFFTDPLDHRLNS